MPRPILILFVLLAGLLLTPVSGCAAAPAQPEFEVADDQYPAVFDATRVELTRMGFDLERIDAQAGVIETRPKQTAGLVTPWDTEQSTLGQEWEDFTNDQRRVVRVTFDSPTETPTESTDPPMREVRVEVTVYRLRVPGRRIETEAVRLSSRSIDEQELASGRAGLYLTPIGRDTRLESRLASGIEKRARALALAE